MESQTYPIHGSNDRSGDADNTPVWSLRRQTRHVIITIVTVHFPAILYQTNSATKVRDGKALPRDTKKRTYGHRRETRLSTSQHSEVFEPVKPSSSCHRRTFIPATVKPWNCLPQDIVNTRDLPNFKRKINAYLSDTRQRPV
ncbi:hypothetical protein Bbelb_065580 [Branchiostoma belcheri]|nr:hypothetical protein Bbelb_065580 [Branchiostoma belcheri]